MKRLSLFLLLVLCAVEYAGAQLLYDKNVLAKNKAKIQDEYYNAAYKKLIKYADTMLPQQAESVMDKSKVASSGNKHDYCSLSYYAWPDESKPNQLPYVIKDGVPNPEYKEYDYDRLVRLSDRINTLALAWYFSGEKKYAEKAIELVKVWFINKKTKMNPNLNYCQVCPGKNGGMGNNVLDGTMIADILNGIVLLEYYEGFSKQDQKALKKWVKAFSKQIQKTDWGKKNLQNNNNQGIAYDRQLLTYWSFIGERNDKRKNISGFNQRRLFKQLAADGSQPQETCRTRGYHYSWYNIHFISEFLIIAKNQNERIDQQVSDSGLSFYSAIDFLIPYLGKPKSAWQFQEISNWDDTQLMARRELYRIAHSLEPKYLPVLNACGSIPQDDIYRLVY